ncbi:MAG: WXG100 family type VII secretion target [Oscillospiraceae bacterium]|jgi:WXG100 family type VII secretion target|nr:WXG100 family type VII secretion target [Oscillospiraceae bacterium]
MGFRINHSKVISQANSIADDADRLGSQVNQLTAMEQDVRMAWKGQAADTFLKRLATLKGEISRTKQQMANLASTIRYCADRIQREDEEAERRAAALKTSGN